MASEVDICNTALAHIGDGATVASIDPPEGSVQAEYCARFYPIARDALLEMHDWAFATRRAQLAQLVSPSSAWLYCYAAPGDLLTPISVLDVAATDDAIALGQAAPQPFSAETAIDGSLVIYTNQPNAVLRYVGRVKDTTRFSPLFVQCLGRSLASLLSGPIIKGDAGATESARQQVIAFGRDGQSGVFGLATAADSKHKAPGAREKHQAPWIAAR